MSDSKSIEKLFRMSEAYYLPHGYHTPEHRLQVIENARHLGSLAIRSGHQYDPVILDLSAAWHDAGLALNPADTYFKHTRFSSHADYNPDSSERLAAMLFNQQASKLDIPLDLNYGVFRAILGTNPDLSINTVESKLLAAADIVAVGLGSYVEIKNNTLLLWQEAQIKSGENIDWQKFVAGSINYLGKFTARRIHLTPRYFNEKGNSAWHSGAVDNIAKLAKETWPKVSLASSIKQPTQTIPYKHEEVTLLGSDKESYLMTVNVPLENNRIIIP